MHVRSKPIKCFSISSANRRRNYEFSDSYHEDCDDNHNSFTYQQVDMHLHARERLC